MGLDLKLLPFLGTTHFSTTILDCTRCGEVFEKIREIPSNEVPENFSHMAGEYQTDSYGKRLRFVRAGDLWKVFKDTDPVSCYLKALPPERRVALYWY